MAAGLATGVGLSPLACAGNGDDVYSVPAALKAADAGADASKGLDSTPGEDGEDAESGAQDAPAEALEAAGDAADASTPTLALLRMANWSADSPQVDFCLAVHGTAAFHGPVLAANAAAINKVGGLDAGSGALSFPQASSYLVVEPAQYDARLVAGGSVDCSTAIMPDATSLPALASAGRETLALFGSAHPQSTDLKLQILGFLDDSKSLLTALLIRGINASLDLAKMDMGTTSAGMFSPIVNHISFGGSSIGQYAVGTLMPDPNGYVITSPLASATLAVYASDTAMPGGMLATPLGQASNVSVGAGGVLTLVVVGRTSSSGGSGLRILACVDNAATAGLVGNCQILSQ